MAAGTALAVAAVVGVVVVATAGRSAEDRLNIESKGREAPTFSVPDLRQPGGRIELAAYRGRPVVLNFWASWCVPCRKEMPAFEEVHRRVGDRVVFVGMDHQDGRTPARALLEETGVTYPSGHDPEGKVASAYGLVGMPTTVFISASGQRVATRTGEMTRAELEEALERLFRVGARPQRSVTI